MVHWSLQKSRCIHRHPLWRIDRLLTHTSTSMQDPFTIHLTFSDFIKSREVFSVPCNLVLGWQPRVVNRIFYFQTCSASRMAAKQSFRLNSDSDSWYSIKFIPFKSRFKSLISNRHFVIGCTSQKHVNKQFGCLHKGRKCRISSNLDSLWGIVLCTTIVVMYAHHLP